MNYPGRKIGDTNIEQKKSNIDVKANSFDNMLTQFPKLEEKLRGQDGAAHVLHISADRHPKTGHICYRFKIEPALYLSRSKLGRFFEKVLFFDPKLTDGMLDIPPTHSDNIMTGLAEITKQIHQSDNEAVPMILEKFLEEAPNLTLPRNYELEHEILTKRGSMTMTGYSKYDEHSNARRYLGPGIMLFPKGGKLMFRQSRDITSLLFKIQDEYTEREIQEEQKLIKDIVDEHALEKDSKRTKYIRRVYGPLLKLLQEKKWNLQFKQETSKREVGAFIMDESNTIVMEEQVPQHYLARFLSKGALLSVSKYTQNSRHIIGGDRETDSCNIKTFGAINDGMKKYDNPETKNSRACMLASAINASASGKTSVVITPGAFMDISDEEGEKFNSIPTANAVFTHQTGKRTRMEEVTNTPLNMILHKLCTVVKTNDRQESKESMLDFTRRIAAPIVAAEEAEEWERRRKALSGSLGPGFDKRLEENTPKPKYPEQPAPPEPKKSAPKISALTAQNQMKIAEKSMGKK
jgi:hypothetical protein